MFNLAFFKTQSSFNFFRIQKARVSKCVFLKKTKSMSVKRCFENTIIKGSLVCERQTGAQNFKISKKVIFKACFHYEHGLKHSLLVFDFLTSLCASVLSEAK